MKVRPKLEDSAVLSELSQHVEQGQYVLYTQAAQLPGFITNHAGDRFAAAVVAASGYDPGSQGMNGDSTPSGTMFLVRFYRRCDHDGSPHFNVDDRVFWSDHKSRCWSASSKEAPDHYESIVAGSGFVDLSRTYHFPDSELGTLQEFCEPGGFLDFKGPCPGL